MPDTHESEDDDMTEAEFDRLVAKAEPAKIIARPVGEFVIRDCTIEPGGHVGGNE